jgi:hypothetical protein
MKKFLSMLLLTAFVILGGCMGNNEEKTASKADIIKQIAVMANESAKKAVTGVQDGFYVSTENGYVFYSLQDIVGLTAVQAEGFWALWGYAEQEAAETSYFKLNGKVINFADLDTADLAASIEANGAAITDAFVIQESTVITKGTTGLKIQANGITAEAISAATVSVVTGKDKNTIKVVFSRNIDSNEIGVNIKDADFVVTQTVDGVATVVTLASSAVKTEANGVAFTVAAVAKGALDKSVKYSLVFKAGTPIETEAYTLPAQSLEYTLSVKTKAITLTFGTDNVILTPADIVVKKADGITVVALQENQYIVNDKTYTFYFKNDDLTMKNGTLEVSGKAKIGDVAWKLSTVTQKYEYDTTGWTDTDFLNNYEIKIKFDGGKDDDGDGIVEITADGKSTIMASIFVAHKNADDNVLKFNASAVVNISKGSTAQDTVTFQNDGYANVQIISDVFDTMTTASFRANITNAPIGNAWINNLPTKEIKVQFKPIGGGSAGTSAQWNYISLKGAEAGQADRILVTFDVLKDVKGDEVKLSPSDFEIWANKKYDDGYEDNYYKVDLQVGTANKMNIKSVLKISDTAAYLILDTDNRSKAQNSSLIDNMRYTVRIPSEVIKNGGKSVLNAGAMDFVLTDTKKAGYVNVSLVEEVGFQNPLKIKVEFSEAVAYENTGAITNLSNRLWAANNPANYILNGVSLADGRFGIAGPQVQSIEILTFDDYATTGKEFWIDENEDQRNIVIITLKEEFSLNKNYNTNQFYLQVANVADWAGAPKTLDILVGADIYKEGDKLQNITETQTLPFTTNIIPQPPRITKFYKDNSEEQYIIEFDGPVVCDEADLYKAVQLWYGKKDGVKTDRHQLTFGDRTGDIDEESINSPNGNNADEDIYIYKLSSVQDMTRASDSTLAITKANNGVDWDYTDDTDSDDDSNIVNASKGLRGTNATLVTPGTSKGQVYQYLLVELRKDWTEIMAEDISDTAAFYIDAQQVDLVVQTKAFKRGLWYWEGIADPYLSIYLADDDSSAVADMVSRSTQDVTGNASDSTKKEGYVTFLMTEPVQMIKTEISTNQRVYANATGETTEPLSPSKGQGYRSDLVPSPTFLFVNTLDNTTYKGQIVDNTLDPRDYTFAVNPVRDDGTFVKLNELSGKDLTKWVVKISSLSDDVKNTFRTQIFPLTLDAPDTLPPTEGINPETYVAWVKYIPDTLVEDSYDTFDTIDFVTGAPLNGKTLDDNRLLINSNKVDGDKTKAPENICIVEIKFSRVMKSGSIKGVEHSSNYFINGKTVPANKITVLKGIDGVTDDWDGVTLVIDEARYYGDGANSIAADDRLLVVTLPHNLQDEAGGELVNSYNEKNEFNLEECEAADDGILVWTHDKVDQGDRGVYVNGPKFDFKDSKIDKITLYHWNTNNSEFIDNINSKYGYKLRYDDGSKALVITNKNLSYAAANNLVLDIAGDSEFRLDSSTERVQVYYTSPVSGKDALIYNMDLTKYYGPMLIGVETVNPNNTPEVEYAKLTFNKAVKDSIYQNGDFMFGTAFSGAAVLDTVAGGTAEDSTDNAVLYFDMRASDLPTDAIPVLTIIGTAADIAGLDNKKIEMDPMDYLYTFTTVDKACPILTAVNTNTPVFGDATQDTLTFVFSEAVKEASKETFSNDIAATRTELNNIFTFGAGAITSAVNIGNTNINYDGSGAANFVITFTGTLDSDFVPNFDTLNTAHNVVVKGDGLMDLSGNKVAKVEVKQLTNTYSPQGIAVNEVVTNVAASIVDVNDVTANITLPTTASNGQTITWGSSNTAVISNSGIVTKPAIGQLNATVILTATSGNESAKITVIVKALTDTTVPVIELIGDATVIITVGDAYTDAGANVTDNVDATKTITGVSTVNTAVPGTYTVTFNTTDAAGNVAITVVRTVTVNAPITVSVTAVTKTFESVLYKEFTGTVQGTGVEGLIVKLYDKLMDTAISNGSGIVAADGSFLIENFADATFGYKYQIEKADGTKIYGPVDL